MGFGVVVPVHHSPRSARRASDVGMAESAHLVASHASIYRARFTLDIAGRAGHRLCRRSPGPARRRIRVRRLRRSDRGWSLLELVRPSLGTESMVARRSDNPVHRIARRHLSRVLRTRTHDRLSEALGSALRIWRRADRACGPRAHEDGIGYAPIPPRT